MLWLAPHATLGSGSERVDGGPLSLISAGSAGAHVAHDAHTVALGAPNVVHARDVLTHELVSVGTEGRLRGDPIKGRVGDVAVASAARAHDEGEGLGGLVVAHGTSIHEKMRLTNPRPIGLTAFLVALSHNRLRIKSENPRLRGGGFAT